MTESGDEPKRNLRDTIVRYLSLDRPPGPVFHAFCLAAGFSIVWGRSLPTTYLTAWWGGFLLGGLLSVVWAVRWLFMPHFQTSDEAMEPRARRRWLYAPVIALIALPLAYTDLPFQARFEASRPQLDRAARDFGAGHDERDRVIGLYRIDSVERIGSAVVFEEETGGFMWDWGGFAYT